MTPLLAALALTAVCALEAPNAQRSDIDYAALYAAGESFASFLSKAEQRKDLWNGNYRRAAVADALSTRARRVTGTWHVLVVAVDSCSDSASTIPYIARLLERMPNVSMRIIDPKLGEVVMQAHRTSDGRAATPTVILLDSAFVRRGCWVERPAPLQSLIAGREKSDKDPAVFTDKMAWYDKDQGASTLEEVVTMLERASAGEVACAPAAPPPAGYSFGRNR
ncbi:MAG: thioredoxin family protein [Gemmatimonadaceae bacterium]